MCFRCYKSGKDGYCAECRESLFDGAKVKHKLTFNLADITKVPSIPGVQLKYSLYLKGSKLLPADKKEGQYILKTVPALEIKEWDDAPENEHLTMQIAEQIYDMRTANNALIYCKDDSIAYLTRRFDIKPNGKKYLMENMAQLSGRSQESHGERYQYKGTYEEIGLLIRKYIPVSTPALETFYQQVVFNYLFSNGEAHLKNFSLIQTDAGDYALSPAYGLICTAPHMPNLPGTALPLYEGAEEHAFYKTYGFYGRPEFLVLAQKIGILPGRAEKIINQLLAPADEVIVIISNSLLQEVTKEKYIQAFQERMKRLKMTI
jgi:serine/threonine-protein kinase HipA